VALQLEVTLKICCLVLIIITKLWSTPWGGH
jgi:hypothetical protein